MTYTLVWLQEWISRKTCMLEEIRLCAQTYDDHSKLNSQHNGYGKRGGRGGGKERGWVVGISKHLGPIYLSLNHSNIQSATQITPTLPMAGCTDKLDSCL